MKIKSIVSAIILATSISSVANAANQLSGSLSVDNNFSLYVSTNDSELGTLVTSTTGDAWMTPVSFTTGLTAGVTNYIHLVAENVGGPAGFVGTFNLSGTGFQFANNSTTLTTDNVNWNVNGTGFGSPSWTAASLGNIGSGPWGWNSAVTNSQQTGAQWIWKTAGALSNAPTGDKAYFSTAVAAVPEPETYAMLLAGLGLMGGIARRRNQVK